MIQGFKIGDNGPVEKYDYQSLENKPQFDTNLAVTGRIADAGAVGTEINRLDTRISNVNSSIPTLIQENIQDNTTSSTSSWSSQKINDQVHSLINNEDVSTTKTWSSSKINERIGNVINDVNTSLNNTWSGEKISTQINNAVMSYINSTLDLIYPIGSIYISTTNVNPGKINNPTQGFLPGRWQHWGDGRAIFGASNDSESFMYGSEQQGGKHYVTLTIDNIPQHTHTYSKKGNLQLTTIGAAHPSTGGIVNCLKTVTAADSTTNSGAAGKSSPTQIDIMPYYITAWLWKRVE